MEPKSKYWIVEQDGCLEVPSAHYPHKKGPKQWTNSLNWLEDPKESAGVQGSGEIPVEQRNPEWQHKGAVKHSASAALSPLLGPT